MQLPGPGTGKERYAPGGFRGPDLRREVPVRMLRLPARLERLQRRAAGVGRRGRSGPHVPVGHRLALGQSRPHGTDLGRRAALQLLVAPQKQETALTLRRLRPLRRHPPVLHLHRHGGRGSQRQRRRKGAVESRGEIPGRLFPLLAPAALRSHLPRRGNHPERRSGGGLPGVPTTNA